MKKTILLFSALLMTAFSFAQKKELKAAEKALKKENVAEAKAALASLASTIENADAKYKAQYLFLKGKTYYEMAKSGMDAETSYKTAGQAISKLIELEKAQKSLKYTKEAQPILANLLGNLVNKAIENQKGKNFKGASEKLYLAYELDPSNKEYLYYASSAAINGKHYDEALKYLEKLKSVNYTGVKTEYFATSVKTGEEELFHDKILRDFSVKGKTHIKPIDKTTKSKASEIDKNRSWIYSNHVGDDDKALTAIEDAIVANPDDTSLIFMKGNLYHKLGKTDKFKETMEEVISRDPNNPDSHYNIGVVHAKNGDIDAARKSYKKTLEIDPGYIDAGINLSKTYIDQGNVLLDKMNALGNSSADNRKYDEYKIEKDGLYRVAMTELEKVFKHAPEDVRLLKQLKNLYSYLGEDAKFDTVKAKLIELGQ